MEELIKELRHNKRVNKKNNLENKVDIDYMIERLKETEDAKQNTINLAIGYINVYKDSLFHKRIANDLLDILKGRY